MFLGDRAYHRLTCPACGYTLLFDVAIAAAASHSAVAGAAQPGDEASQIARGSATDLWMRRD